MIREFAKGIPAVRHAAIRKRMKNGVTGQSDEGAILRRLSDELSAPKTFVEFGFHPAEFNCAALTDDHQGLLIDGNPHHVEDARHFLPQSVTTQQRFLTLENLDIVRTAFPELGVLSIDVDGNDYWFTEALIETNPAILVVEYNASFLLNSITVEYDPSFDRSKKHSTGWYHGASLQALARLAQRHGYGLAAVSTAGGNAFFTKSGDLDPETAWRPSTLRNEWSGTTAEQQWAAVSGMPFVPV
jgi:hypothetical protein